MRWPDTCGGVVWQSDSAEGVAGAVDRALRWLVAVGVGVVGFGLPWWISEEWFALDRPTAIALAAVAAPLVASPFGWWATQQIRPRRHSAARLWAMTENGDHSSSSHVFICYSHRDGGSYAEQLARFISDAAIPVWFDKEIHSGNRWSKIIQDRIDTCAAFVVVMTPAADESEWVEREIARARAKRKTILPLLLAGEPFFSLSNIQYEDVTHRRMPSAALLDRVRTLVGQSATAAMSTQDSGAESPPTVPFAEAAMLSSHASPQIDQHEQSGRPTHPALTDEPTFDRAPTAAAGSVANVKTFMPAADRPIPHPEGTVSASVNIAGHANRPRSGWHVAGRLRAILVGLLITLIITATVGVLMTQCSDERASGPSASAFTRLTVTATPVSPSTTPIALRPGDTVTLTGRIVDYCGGLRADTGEFVGIRGQDHSVDKTAIRVGNRVTVTGTILGPSQYPSRATSGGVRIPVSCIDAPTGIWVHEAHSA